MTWKRRRERWRKLPERSQPHEGIDQHWGRNKIPKVSGGPEIGLSASGEVSESRPWPFSKWLLMLPVGIAAVLFFFPFLFTGFFWLGLAALLLFLTYRSWRGQ